MAKPIVLISNDDGIESPFLKHLVEVLQDDFVTFVAAPKSEKSWISKAITRHQSVHVEPSTIFKCKAWSIDGTPSDCINIALGHLLEKRPDIVLTGINISYNISLPLILSSGTLAGALEASCWGIRSIAFSQQIPRQEYDKIKQTKTPLLPELQKTLLLSTCHAKNFAHQMLDQAEKQYCVHNINFPFPLAENTSIVKTYPDHIHLGSLFSKTTDNSYSFTFSNLENTKPGEQSDRACLAKGNISHSILDYSRLATTL